MIRRRSFITLLGGAAVAWPAVARGQQGERAKRIGVLMNLPPNDLQGQARIAAFVQRLRQLGWNDGSNVRIDYRWGPGDADSYRKTASELIALVPDVILANGNSTMGPLQLATRSVPIVFTQVTDPVGVGYVDSLARPGGNSTGFLQFEYSLSAKWLELLKQVAPSVTRAAILRDPANPASGGQLGAIQAVAPSLNVEVTPVGVRDADEIERAITAFARKSNGGLVVQGSPSAIIHRAVIIRLAAQHRLPAVYPYRYYVTDGGLISYRNDPVDQYPRAAEYVDRILKGEKTADLPVQAPTKYELVINLKTARSLGLEILPTLLARADEVIE